MCSLATKCYRTWIPEMLWNIQNSQCMHSSFNHIHQPSLHRPHLARNKLAEAPWWQESRKRLIAVAAPQNLRKNWPQKSEEVKWCFGLFWHNVLAYIILTDHVHVSTQNSGSGIVFFWLRTCLGGIYCSVHFPCYHQDFGAGVFTTFWTSNLSFSMLFATLWCSNCSCCTVFCN